jgi:hypothetical protein
MTAPPVRFSRLIVDLGSGAPDRATLRYVAEFAKLLKIDLLGLWARDQRLAGLAGLPVLREFRTLERRWLAVPGANLARDLERAAEFAQRALDEAGVSAGVTCHFEFAQAPAAEAITAAAGATDIIVAAPARALHDRALQPFPDFLAAALATPAAVLIVPDRVVRSRGPILTIAETPEDPLLLASAAAIALAANERSEVVTASSLALPPPIGLPDSIRERLIVMSRSADASVALATAAHRSVPVLVLRPATTADTDDERRR